MSEPVNVHDYERLAQDCRIVTNPAGTERFTYFRGSALPKSTSMPAVNGKASACSSVI